MYLKKSLILAVALITSAHVANALLVIEDFEFYPDSTNITYQSGGNGFIHCWSTGDNMSIRTNRNLAYTATGYSVDSLGIGCVKGLGSGGTMTKRTFGAPVYGTTEGRTIWFSSLVESTSGGRIGWSFNPTGTSRSTADAGFLFVGRDLRKLDDTALISVINPVSDGVHLVIGSIILKDTGDSTVSFWIDPTDVSSTNALGAADFSFGADFNGSLLNMGIEGYGTPAGFIDAIRISDGRGDPDRAFSEVTGKTPNILFGPVDFDSMHEFTNNFALLSATTNDWISSDDDNYGSGGYLKPNQDISNKHHTYVIDTDGVLGGSDDVFGQCTIDFDCRNESLAGVHFYSETYDGDHRTQKHWILLRTDANKVLNAYYDRNMNNQSGHTLETNVTHTITGSDWRHFRLDIRRINNFTQVEARTRIWDNASDFRSPPLCDHTFTYSAAHTHLYSSEIGISSYLFDGSAAKACEIDNVVVYRYGTAPEWFKPNGTMILIQ